MSPHPNRTFCTDVQFGLQCSFEKCAVLENLPRGAYVTLSYYGRFGESLDVSQQNFEY